MKSLAKDSLEQNLKVPGEAVGSNTDLGATMVNSNEEGDQMIIKEESDSEQKTQDNRNDDEDI